MTSRSSTLIVLTIAYALGCASGVADGPPVLASGQPTRALQAVAGENAPGAEIVSQGARFEQTADGEWKLLAASNNEAAPVTLVQYKDVSRAGTRNAYAAYAHIYAPVSPEPGSPPRLPFTINGEPVVSFEYINGVNWPIRGTRKINGGAVGTKAVVYITKATGPTGVEYARHAVVLFPPPDFSTRVATLRLWLGGQEPRAVQTTLGDNRPVYVETMFNAEGQEVLSETRPITAEQRAWLDAEVLPKAEGQANLDKIEYK